MNAEMLEALMSEGYAAYEDGLHSDECPYERGSAFASEWLEGWREAYNDSAPARESEAEDKRLDDQRHGA